MAAVRNERPTVSANKPDAAATPTQHPASNSLPFLENGPLLRGERAAAALGTKHGRRSFLFSPAACPTAARLTAAAPLEAVAQKPFFVEETEGGEDAAMATALAHEGRETRAGYLKTKRVLDIVIASLALLFLSPLLLLIALAIVMEGRGRGPILFHQKRVGKNGHVFRFYKFRSMVPDAEARLRDLAAHNEACGPIFKMRRDPRVTRVGRWLRKSSMDELPQLFNVLKGDMSLVGPRPHLPREVETYDARQRQRLQVQPGLLCLREVSGRSHLTFEQWIESDLTYIERRSLSMDLSILLRTLPAILKGDGAY